MPRKTFQEKYAESREQAYTRLVENNFYGGASDNYVGAEDTKIYYIKDSYVIDSLSFELVSFIGEHGITMSEIKDNFSTIALDALNTLQQDPRYIRKMEEDEYVGRGIIDMEGFSGMTNEELVDPKNKDEMYSYFGVDSNRKFFNKIFTPIRACYSLDAVYQKMTPDSPISDIKNALNALATVKKIHDSRPFFGRPSGYDEETKAIDDYTKRLRAYGFTDKDMTKIFDSSDKNLQNTIDTVCHNRLEIAENRTNQEDYSRANQNNLSPHNLHSVFKTERTYVLGSNGAKHGIRLLNSFIAAKRKYESAGFFTKYFNKDYRDLKKSIDTVENFLTSDKLDNGNPKDQMFTKAQLKDLLNRQEPLNIHDDVTFLNEHHINTIENGNVPRENNVQNNVQENSARKRIEIPEVNNQLQQEYNKEEKTNDIPTETIEKQP